MILEDRNSWAKTAAARDRLAIDFQTNFVERHLPTTTVGLGAAGVVWKGANTHHAMWTETGTWNKFVKNREEVLVWTSDQGEDFEVAESPLLCAADGSDLCVMLRNLRAGHRRLEDLNPSEVYFLPNAMRLGDSYHLMFGGFEAVVTEHIEYKNVEKHFTAIAHYLGDSDLRTRTLVCLESKFDSFEAAAIKAWSVGRQFNWKWQYLLRSWLRSLLCCHLSLNSSMQLLFSAASVG